MFVFEFQVQNEGTLCNYNLSFDISEMFVER